MSNIPSQDRAIDPFAEYNSNVHNKLTRILSQGTNCLVSRNSLNVIVDSTTPATFVEVVSGIAIKDDVMVQVTANHRVDFDDTTNYVTAAGGMNETGWYYIVLEYTYAKSRPAPQARIKIVKPSQRATFLTQTALLFLKAIPVINNGSRNVVDVGTEFSSFDPENPTHKREYVYRYVSTEPDLPTHDSNRDPSRFVYEEDTDSFWIGYSDRWEQLSNNTVVLNTSTLAAGDLCYIDSSGVAAKAIASGELTKAEMVVANIGTAGQGKIIGFVEDVPVETGSIFNVGDNVYLSTSETGKVTSSKGSSYQNVGRCTAVGTGVIDMLFIPGDYISAESYNALKVTATLSSWTLSGGYYYSDVNIAAIGNSNTNITVRDSSGVVQPYNITFPTANTARIWMPVNTVTLYATIIG